MNQKKAKAIRRGMKKLHGYTKSSTLHPVVMLELPIITIFTESKFRRVFKRHLAEKLDKLRSMGATVPMTVLVRRVVAELPEVGTMLQGNGRVKTKREAHAAEGRTLYQAEKKRYYSIPKKLRRTV